MNHYANLLSSYWVKKGWLAPELQTWGTYVIEKRILHLCGILVFLLLLGLTCGFTNALAFYVTFFLLRGCCGGWHATKPLTCIMVSLLIVGALNVIRLIVPEYTIGISLGCAIPGMTVLLIWAPVCVEQMQLTDEARRACRKQLMLRGGICFLAILIGFVFSSLHMQESCTYIAFAFFLTALSVAVERLKKVNIYG